MNYYEGIKLANANKHKPWARRFLKKVEHEIEQIIESPMVKNAHMYNKASRFVKGVKVK